MRGRGARCDDEAKQKKRVCGDGLFHVLYGIPVQMHSSFRLRLEIEQLELEALLRVLPSAIHSVQSVVTSLLDLACLLTLFGGHDEGRRGTMRGTT